MKTEHFAALAAVLAVLVTVFGQLRDKDGDLVERVSRLEARVDSIHEYCCNGSSANELDVEGLYAWHEGLERIPGADANDTHRQKNEPFE